MAALVAQSLGVYAPLNDPRLVEVRLAINGMLIQPTSNLFSHSLRVLRPTRTALVNDTVRDTELHFNPRILKTSQDKFREGNGRASKLFLAQLADQTRFDFDFDAVHPDVWNQRSMLTRPDLGQYLPHHRELLPVFDHITIDRPHAAAAGTAEHDRAQHLSLTPEPLTYQQHPEPASYTQHPDNETRYRGYGGPESPGHHRGMSR